MAVETPYRLSLEQYERMVQADVLTEDDAVELIDGELWEMAPQSEGHSALTSALAELLNRALDDLAAVRVQMPIRLPPRSMPEPDITVAVSPQRRYLAHHPQVEDIYLLVEVVQSRRQATRRRKIPVYARHGIREVWLLDVPAERVEVYRGPGPDGYASIEVTEREGSLTPDEFPGVSVRVNDILP